MDKYLQWHMYDTIINKVVFVSLEIKELNSVPSKI